MVQSKASTVAEYLAELPAEQRAEVSAVRDVILANLVLYSALFGIPQGWKPSPRIGEGFSLQ